jgi:hypothetical protein
MKKTLIAMATAMAAGGLLNSPTGRHRRPEDEPQPQRILGIEADMVIVDELPDIHDFIVLNQEEAMDFGRAESRALASYMRPHHAIRDYRADAVYWNGSFDVNEPAHATYISEKPLSKRAKRRARGKSHGKS